jgi:hypothetical protein
MKSQDVGENCIMRSFITCASPSIIRMNKSRRMRWAGHVARRGRRGMHIGYCWENQREISMSRPICWWVDNIKMDLREMGWHGLD